MKHKNIRELTEKQLKLIATLALEDINTLDWFKRVYHNLSKPNGGYRIEPEFWDDDKKMMVIRVYPPESECYCAIWENDNRNKLDITVVNHSDPEDVANQVTIVKKLIDWGFV